MKTLKKTLCLVLAVVMVLGLCVMSASADLEYTDNDKITYKEAVDVMSGIGVLAGDERGFRPTDTITRAEAAKIVAYLLVGNATQADALKANVDPFTDVPASHWAAGYIAYCVNAGVINGMGDGTFAPGENVTGLQFAKMLLCALGYNANDEYVNNDWAISVSKDALRLGIFDKNLAGATNTPATREECALYAFNVVHGANDYEGLYKVSYSALLGGYISSGSVGADAGDANKKQTFAQDFDLNKNDEDGDDFGRMAGHSWYVKNAGNVISAVYSDDNDLKATYYGKVTKGDVADVLGSNFIKDVKKNSLSKYEVWINGVKDAGTDANAIIDLDKLTKGNKDNLSKDAASETGKGVETLIYAGVDDHDDSWIRIVIVDTYLAKVTSVAKDDTVTVQLLNDKNNAAIIGTTTFIKDGLKIKAEGFKKGDYVLVTAVEDEDDESKAAVKTIEKAPTAEDKVSRYQKSGDTITFTVAGTAYEAAKNAAKDDPDLKAADDDQITQRTIVDGKKHTLYLDKHGYALAIADVEEDSDYVYVSHFGQRNTSGEFDGADVGVKVYYVDGTSKVLTLNTEWNDPSNLFYNKVTVDDLDEVYDAAHVNIYKLTMKDGKAVLSDAGDDALLADSNVNGTGAAEKKANIQVRKNISNIVRGTDTVKADSKTVFFYVNDEAWDSKDFKVTPYVGIGTVRTMKDNDATVQAYIAPAVEHVTTADAVLVLDGAEGETDDTVYLYTGNYDTKDYDDLTVVYETYVNGEITSLEIKYDNYDDKDEALVAFDGYVNEFFTLNADKEPTATTLVDKDGYAKKINKSRYESKLEIEDASNADEFTFKVTDASNPASVSKDGNLYSYATAEIIDLTDGTDVKIESINDLEAALEGTLDDYAISGLKVSVQYDDTTSNGAIVVYVVAHTDNAVGG